MKITAIIALRNEARYLRVVLKHLVDSDIRIAIIDNESTDNSRSIIDEFKKHIDFYQVISYKGFFDWSELLNAKQEVIKRIDADWVIHQDADEMLQSPIADESLKQGIERVASAGCTAINFDEFVFVPTKEKSVYSSNNFLQEMLHYYFFELRPFRLMRAWKNSPGVCQCNGGHRLESNTPLVFPSESFILRHYIVLDQHHATLKYAKRKFSEIDLSKGWHRNRLNFPAQVSFPLAGSLQKLSTYSSKDFVKNNPWKKHFWEINQV